MKALTFQGKEKIVYGNVADPTIAAASDAIVKVKQGIGSWNGHGP